jgi:hypothetical protein
MWQIQTNMTFQIVIAAKNNITAISFFKKTRKGIWNDTGWGTRLGSSNSTSAYSTCLHRLSSYLECRITSQYECSALGQENKFHTHKHKTTGKFVILNFLIFRFLGHKKQWHSYPKTTVLLHQNDHSPTMSWIQLFGLKCSSQAG